MLEDDTTLVRPCPKCGRLDRTEKVIPDSCAFCARCTKSIETKDAAAKRRIARRKAAKQLEQ